MLEPGSRRLFLDTLRPPEGYSFDRAIGATFTLDLMALLSVPLAFSFGDAQDSDGELATDPLALLEGARRHASRVAVFCHGGRMAAPRAAQPALAFLEKSVISAFPLLKRDRSAVFHPKVWVLRYVPREDSDLPTRYRLICQSRNLTFDASWDASLVLDATLNHRRVRGYPNRSPLVDFIERLPRLASGPVPDFHAESVELFADELRRVEFDMPAGLSLRRFWHFGIKRANNDDFPDPDLRQKRILVMSPFLGGEFLRKVAGPGRRSVLISRREELLKAPPDAIRAFSEVYAFRSGLEPEPEDTAAGLPPLAGLHAKLFVIDDGWDARVIIGSANSTMAAVGQYPRNVEFMVELEGKKSVFGIDALLGSGDDQESGKFSSLIEPFCKDEAGTVEDDASALRLERVLDEASDTLSRLDIAAHVTETATGRYAMRLRFGESPKLPSSIESATCWPSTVNEMRRQPLEDGAEFADMSLDRLTAFLTIEVSASSGGEEDRRRFARPVRLIGAPENRLQRLLVSMVKNHKRFMELLWLLLAPDGDLPLSQFLTPSEGETNGAEWGMASPGLLERMMDTLATDPNRLDAVDSLVNDLKETEAGAELIGDDFLSMWETLWKVRESV